MPDVRTVWDLPELGLTKDDFTRWPGRRTFKRSDGHASALNAGYAAGQFNFPVYLVGECTTYDIAHGHPSFPAARHDNVFFAVWGQPGTPWAAITCFRKRLSVLPDFNHIDIEHVQLFRDIGYIDLQFSRDDLRVARIGFPYFKEAPTTARTRANAVLEAILKCRSGTLPTD